MSQARIERRLSAILAADVAGFSRMMGQDEDSTVRTLRQIWAESFNPVVEGFRGRIVKMMGDGALAEFVSATDAVECALAFQRSMLQRNQLSDVPVKFRVGINLGDIIVDGQDILGDGVNIAARLESQAPAGGVLISDLVHGQIRGKSGESFRDCGELSFKNIERPIRCWSWQPDAMGRPEGQASPAPSAAAALAQQAIKFGSVTFSPAERLLRVDGQVAPLGVRAFDLLAALIAHRYRVVSQSQLIDEVWKGMEVSTAGLQTQIAALRKVLGQRAIATIPGRGYQFTLTDDAGPKPMESSGGTWAGSASSEALAAPAAETHSLPPAPVSVLGRADDAQALALAMEQHRLVTVVGPGGMGKTTLALAAAHERKALEAQGAAWIDLAALTDSALLASHIAAAMGISVAGNNPTMTLIKALSGKRLLIVLDNAEHVLEATAALVDSLIKATEGPRVLVTSQAALNVDGERVFRLSGLALPPSGLSAEEAMSHGAVALFVDQARMVDRRFELTNANLAAVVEVCSRLDGVALAIKLAAARVPLLGLEGLVARLSDRLRILSHGSRSAPTRQQTLRAALDWSHSLLSEEDQTVFRRLGVFAAGFDLSLASKVACDEHCDEWEVIERIGSLVDRSLVMFDSHVDGRYRLLESTREYAVERLAASGEKTELNRRVVQVLREHHPDVVKAEPAMVARHLSESGQLAEAVDEWERAGTLAVSKVANVEAAQYFRKAVDTAAQLISGGRDELTWQRRKLALLFKLGPLMMFTKGVASQASEAVYVEALKLSEHIGTAVDCAIASFNLWINAESQLKLDEAAQYIERSNQFAQATGDDRFIVHAKHAAYNTAFTVGDFNKTLVEAEDGYQRYRPVDRAFHQSTFGGHDPGLCSVGHAGMALFVMGRPSEAFAKFDELQRWIAESPHPPSRIVGQYVTCIGYILACEPLRMQAIAEDALATCKKLSIVQHEGMFTVCTVWARSVSGSRDPVAKTLAEAIRKFESTGAKLRVSLLKTIAAEACAFSGEVLEGLAFAEQGLVELLMHKELGWHAYALIVKGNCLAQLERFAEARKCFQEANDVCLRQGAVGLQLRGAIGLARFADARESKHQALTEVQQLLQHYRPDLHTRLVDEARALCAQPG